MTWSRPGFWNLLKAEPRPAPAVLTRTVEDRPGYTVERLVFDFGAAGPVRGIVTRASTISARRPALLYMHAHGGRFDIGVNEILDGQPATLSPLGQFVTRIVTPRLNRPADALSPLPRSLIETLLAEARAYDRDNAAAYR